MIVYGVCMDELQEDDNGVHSLHGRLWIDDSVWCVHG
jgi:hypothetical protein